MLLKKISESKMAINAPLIAEIKQKSPLLDQLRDETINNILTIFKETQDLEEVGIDGFIEWFDECETLAEFVFLYGDDLYTYSIEDFAQHDEKLAQAIKQVLIDAKIVDENGIDLSTTNEIAKDKSTKLTLLQMCTILFDTWAEKSIRDPNIDVSEIDSKYLTNKKAKDLKARRQTLSYVEEAYHRLFESLKEKHVCEKCGKYPCICKEGKVLKEEDEEPTKEEKEVEVEVEEKEIQEPNIEKEPKKLNYEVSDDIIESGFYTLITEAIKDQWDIINNLNSIITTFNYDYSKDELNKDDILKLLNGLVDDSTINVGMLYKVLELISDKTTTLIGQGIEKADDLVEELVE